VVLAPIASRLGLAGLLLASVMAGPHPPGHGRLPRRPPHRVHPPPGHHGFTAGIAVVIGTLQLKDFLGLRPAGHPEHYLERSRRAAPGRSHPAAGGAVHRAGHPGPAGALAEGDQRPDSRRAGRARLGGGGHRGALTAGCPGFQVDTIASRFGGIPATTAGLRLAVSVSGAGQPTVHLDLADIRMLVPSAFAIAPPGRDRVTARAVVSDGMTGTRHDPDAEPAGAGDGQRHRPVLRRLRRDRRIARTTVNIRSGGRSPLAERLPRTFFVLLAIAPSRAAPRLAARWASMAALLLTVRLADGEVKHFGHILRVAPKSDVAVLLACFSLTVVFDMVVGVTVGWCSRRCS
jgi:SulP family sulfate permease